MTKNLKFEEIDITVTTDPEQINGSMRTRSTVSEWIHQGSGWSIKVFTRTGQLSDGGFKKLKALLAALIWIKSEKTKNLREIKKTIEEKLWKENI